MKRNIFVIAFVAGLSFAGRAQSDKEDVRIALALLNKNKKELITQSIQLDESQKAGFWKLYDDYENKYNRLQTERLGIIEQYVAAYDSLGDATASSIAEHLLRNTLQLDELHIAYFPKFRKAIGGTKAATLYQMEIYIQTALQFKLQNELPMIGQLRKVEHQ
jgi:hypothetical protein